LKIRHICKYGENYYKEEKKLRNAKKLLSLLFVAAMLIGLMPATAFAAVVDDSGAPDATYMVNEAATQLLVQLYSDTGGPYAGEAFHKWTVNGVAGPEVQGAVASIVPDTSAAGIYKYQVYFYEKLLLPAGVIPAGVLPGGANPLGESREVTITVNAGASITILKTDARNKPLAGAKLQLEEIQQAGAVAYQKEILTNNNGEAVFTHIPDGDYKLKEIEAPEGYVKSDKEYMVSIVNGQVQDWLAADQTPLNAAPVFVNQLAGNSFEVEKKDETGRPLRGAVFELIVTGPAIGGPAAPQTAISGADGIATFLNVPAGSFYTLRERTAPAGYDKSDDSYDLEVIAVQGGGYVILIDPFPGANPVQYAEPFAFVNTRRPVVQDDYVPPTASIEVKKTDAAGNALSGAVFVLTNPNGWEAYTASSGANGTATFSGVENGSYTLSEKSAPNGYVKSDETYVIRVLGGVAYLEGTQEAKPTQERYTTVTYVNLKSAPELNKKDHIAFMLGYPDGSFAPDRNITRAEVATIFAHLLADEMEMDKSYPNTFVDVPEDHWCYNEIAYLQQYEIISGYEDGTFRPEAPITRAEFAAIVCKFENLTEGEQSFSDVPDSHWAAQYINYAATRGWVSGYEDGTFRPEDYISRGEVLAAICNILERSADKEYVNSHYDSLRSFSDVPREHWAFWYAMEAANGHYYTKDEDGETWTGIRE